MTGEVKWFNNRRGYGFILGDDGKEIFVHYSGIVGNGFNKLTAGDSVRYDIKATKKSIQAVNVIRTSILITNGEEAYAITLLA